MMPTGGNTCALKCKLRQHVRDPWPFCEHPVCPDTDSDTNSKIIVNSTSIV